MDTNSTKPVLQMHGDNLNLLHKRTKKNLLLPFYKNLQFFIAMLAMLCAMS